MKKAFKKIMKKVRGFTLIELMIAVSIGAIVVSLGVVSLNNFYDKQRVDGAMNDVGGMVRLAKNYAVTMQSPGGYTNPVEYVGLIIGSDGIIKIVPGNNNNGLDIGTTYTSKKVDMNYVSISQLSPGLVMFSIPEGKLVEFADSSNRRVIPRGSGVSVNVLVRSKQSSNVENGVLIHASGVIDEKANSTDAVPTDSLAGESTLTINVATPTLAPTPTTSLIATLAPSATVAVCRGDSVACSTSSQCCSLQCYGGICGSCRPEGVECRGDIDCCSNDCNLGRCAPLPVSGGCEPPMTDPYSTETQYGCVIRSGCGFNDQACL